MVAAICMDLAKTTTKYISSGILVNLLFIIIPQRAGALSVRMIAPIYQDMMALMSMRVDCGVVCAKACVCLCVFVFVCVCALIC